MSSWTNHVKQINKQTNVQILQLKKDWRFFLFSLLLSECFHLYPWRPAAANSPYRCAVHILSSSIYKVQISLKWVFIYWGLWSWGRVGDFDSTLAKLTTRACTGINFLCMGPTHESSYWRAAFSCDLFAQLYSCKILTPTSEWLA